MHCTLYHMYSKYVVYMVTELLYFPRKGLEISVIIHVCMHVYSEDSNLWIGKCNANIVCTLYM